MTLFDFFWQVIAVSMGFTVCHKNAAHNDTF